jgi:hypothetical protein
MGHGDPEPMITVVTIILFAWMLTVVFGYSVDLGPADAVVGFFSQPRPFVVYAILLIAPVFFFKYLQGSMVMFVAGVILFLSLKAGVT